QESEIGRQTKQRRAPHGITHLPQRSDAVLTPNHQLRHHGVIEGGDAVPVSHPGLDPHALRPSHARYAARRRPEAFYRILRIDSAFDRATRGLDLRLRQGQGTARGNLKLPCDQILASDFFRNRVLDLQARIYFQEVKIVLLINDEFERSRGYISDTARASHRRILQPHPDSLGQPDSRRFFHHLLMTPLQGALALEQVHHLALLVAEHLHLVVPGPLDETFHDQASISTAAARHPDRRLERGAQPRQ